MGPPGSQRDAYCGGGGSRYDPTPARYRRHSSGGGGGGVAPGKMAIGPGSWGSNCSQSSHSSGSSYGACTEEPTSSESEVPADGSSGGDSAELSQVIPRIIKPRKRRKKEKKPKIPRMAAAAEERNNTSSCAVGGGGGGVVGRWERRPSSLGADTQSSSESALSAFGSEWYLSGEHLDALCAELTTLRLRRQLTPPELALTPPDSPGAPGGCVGAGWRQLGGLRRSRSEPTHRAQLDDRHSFSCPSSLEFRESPPGEEL